MSVDGYERKRKRARKGKRERERVKQKSERDEQTTDRYQRSDSRRRCSQTQSARLSCSFSSFQKIREKSERIEEARGMVIFQVPEMYRQDTYTRAYTVVHGDARCFHRRMERGEKASVR